VNMDTRQDEAYKAWRELEGLTLDTYDRSAFNAGYAAGLAEARSALERVRELEAALAVQGWEYPAHEWHVRGCTRRQSWDWLRQNKVGENNDSLCSPHCTAAREALGVPENRHEGCGFHNGASDGPCRVAVEGLADSGAVLAEPHVEDSS
jgi:hypothetical protein